MPIEQHPIPQDVAGYKFRLVGEMTLKQFLWLAIGIVIGLVLYSSPLPFFFKYPLATLAACLGAGIAFVPVEGRPLDKWLIAFIKSVYSPTQFVWQKAEESTLSSTPKKTSPLPVSKTPPTTQTSPGTGYVPTNLVAPGQATPTNTTTSGGPNMYARNVTIPKTEKTQVETSTPSPNENTNTSSSTVSPVSSPTLSTINQTTSSAVKQDTHLPIPFTPTVPNTLVGMTLTPDGKILEGALVELRLNGITERATKSNQLGQFLFAKPLDGGTYQIATEKTGFTFETYSISLNGQIVKPLRLQAKSKTT